MVLFSQLALTGTVTRSFSSLVVNPDNSITSKLIINVSAGDRIYSIEEIIPIGFTVINAGGGTLDTRYNIIRWFVTNANDIEYSYIITTLTTGSYEFHGNYMFGNDSTVSTIAGNKTITIVTTSTTTTTTKPGQGGGYGRGGKFDGKKGKQTESSALALSTLNAPSTGKEEITKTEKKEENQIPISGAIVAGTERGYRTLSLVLLIFILAFLFYKEVYDRIH